MAWRPRSLPFLPKKYLSSEMLKAGYAQIYRQAGSEYGGMLHEFEVIEAQARYVKNSDHRSKTRPHSAHGPTAW